MNAYLFQLLLAVYVYLALVVAVLGRRTRLGFWRSLGLGMVLTPVVALVVIFLGFEIRPTRRRLERRAASRGVGQS